MLILLVPMISVQIILGYIFVDRHTERILDMLAKTIAGDITYIVDRVIEQKSLSNSLESRAQANFQLKLKYDAKASLPLQTPQTDKWLYDYMDHALRAKLRYPYTLKLTHKQIYINIKLPKGVLYVQTPRKRLFTSSTINVMVWTTASSILLFLIALIFLRNQVRPIQRLADAAKRFGRGQNVEDYKPEGASEVRRAGQAFQIMKERLSRQMNERLEMLAGVSHDLRTPLTRMKLQLAMMKGKEAKELGKDVEHMQQMVESFLEFSRGMDKEALKSVNLSSEINKIVRQLQLPKSKLMIECPKTIKIKARPLLLNRCLTNLLLNCQRYAENVWISAKQVDEGIFLVVDDNGPGIPAQHREEVFKPFYRLESSRSLATGGSGLGLSIARDAIHSHGGWIRLGDSPHGGLRVEVMLPC